MSIEEATRDKEERVEPASSKRRIRSAIPLFVILVVLAELAVRVGSPKLRDPLLWPGWEAQNKVVAMDRLAKTGGASVVFIGSSMMDAAADPALASKTIGARRPAFNGALSGSDMRSFEIWTRDVVVPRLKPRVVVIGFNSAELNDGGTYQIGFYSKLLESPLGREAAGAGDTLDRIDSWLVENSYLVRYRSVLRHPYDAFNKRNSAQRSVRVDRLGVMRALTKFHQRPYQPGFPRQLTNWEQVFSNYRVGGPQLQALERLVRDLTNAKIKVVLVRMPVTGDVVPLHPHGVADRETFSKALAAFVASHSVTFVDAEAQLGGTTTLFSDPLHLNEAGWQRFTTLVSTAVKPLL